MCSYFWSVPWIDCTPIRNFVTEVLTPRFNEGHITTTIKVLEEQAIVDVKAFRQLTEAHWKEFGLPVGIWFAIREVLQERGKFLSQYNIF